MCEEALAEGQRLLFSETGLPPVVPRVSSKKYRSQPQRSAMRYSMDL